MKKEYKIIEQHCGQVTERIKACKRKHIAEALKQRLCTELDLGCHSEMIKNVLNKYIDDIVKKTFDANGNNIYLEN